MHHGAAGMDMFNIMAMLLVTAAVISYINYKFLHLPPTVGMLFAALVGSLALYATDALAPSLHLRPQFTSMLNKIVFSRALLQWMLGFLLFAGALHINLNDFLKHKWAIGSLATAGVLISAFIISIFSYYIFSWIGIEISYIHCLLFGALISPTDPIAVTAMLKKMSAPSALRAKIAGESLFNDGVGVVLFGMVAAVAYGRAVSVSDTIWMFLREVAGGAAMGLGSGYLAYRAMRSINQYRVEVLISLALAAGTYALASSLGASGPIAVVVAGILTGNHGKRFAMSSITREHLESFWELTDEILNAILFLLIGLEIFEVSYSSKLLWAGALSIAVTLIARTISVALPLAAISIKREYAGGAVPILVWSGLRGGISVAMALSLPSGPQRDIILACTYTVVVFSILVQGTTVKKLLKKYADR